MIIIQRVASFSTSSCSCRYTLVYSAWFLSLVSFPCVNGGVKTLLLASVLWGPHTPEPKVDIQDSGRLGGPLSASPRSMLKGGLQVMGTSHLTTWWCPVSIMGIKSQWVEKPGTPDKQVRKPAHLCSQLRPAWLTVPCPRPHWTEMHSSAL